MSDFILECAWTVSVLLILLMHSMRLEKLHAEIQKLKRDKEGRG